MRLIVDIPEETFNKAKETHDVMCDSVWLGIKNGIPLDDVKAEIADIYCGQYCEYPLTADAMREMILDILDNIDKEREE